MEEPPTRPATERSGHKMTVIPAKILQDSLEEYVDIDPHNEEEDSKYFDNEADENSEEEPLDILTNKARKRVCNSHDVYFKPVVFFEYLICHLLFFLLLGPFIIILKPIYGYNMLWNQGFVGNTPSFWIQIPQYILIILLFVLYFAVPVVEIRFIEILTLLWAIAIRCIIICCKYAYCSEAVLKLMKMKKLSQADFNAELMASNWRVQNTIAITEELHAGILRNDIESSLFFFEFLGKDKTNELVEKFKKENLDKVTKEVVIPSKAVIEENSKGEESTPEQVNNKSAKSSGVNVSNKNAPDKPISHFHVQGVKETSADKADQSGGTFSYEVNPVLKVLAENNAQLHHNLQNINSQLPHFFKKKRLEKCKLYGYNLAFDIILKSRDLRWSSFGKKIFLISFIKAWIPTFYRIYEGGPVFTTQPYLVALTIMINAYFFWANTFIMSISLADLQTKIFSLKQLAYLISPKKITSYREKKYYPTMNLFDPVTIKTWSNIRKLLLDFGLKFTKRNTFNVTVVLIIYSFVLAFLIVQALDIVKSKSDPVMLIVFSVETAIYFIIFFIMLTGSAFLNDQFRVHKNILKNNKTIVADFKRLTYLYVGKKAIKPDNFIYRQGIKSLGANIDDNKNAEKIIARRADTLVDAFEDVIQELEFEETNNPIKVLGIPANYAIVKSLFAVLGSLIFAVVQVKMNN